MRKAVILSLDAFFRADAEALDEKSRLKMLMKEGAVCTRVKTVFPSLTYPAHVTMMTGCYPDRTGIGQNQPYQPQKRENMRAWYWEAQDVQVPTLMDKVKQGGGVCASILWPVTGKNKSVKWNFPQVLALPGENQVLKMLQYGSPLWILAMEIKHGRKRVSIREPHLSDYAAVLCKDVMKHHQPDLTAVHWVDLDEARHHNGTNSPQAKAAIQRLSDRVDMVYQTMRQTPGMEDALLVIVSDHGQADIEKTVSLRKVLSENGFEDVGVQSCGMSAYIMAGAKTEAVTAWLRENMHQSGIKRVYTRQELDEMHCHPMPDLAVEAADLVVFSDELESRKREKATHGFGPGHAAEDCLFAVIGKGIKKGAVIEKMNMVDVAPTIAELMGIEMKQTDGKSFARDLLEK